MSLKRVKNPTLKMYIPELVAAVQDDHNGLLNLWTYGAERPQYINLHGCEYEHKAYAFANLREGFKALDKVMKEGWMPTNIDYTCLFTGAEPKTQRQAC